VKDSKYTDTPVLEILEEITSIKGVPALESNTGEQLTVEECLELAERKIRERQEE